MEASPPVTSSSPVATPRVYSWYHPKRLGRNFLIVAILVHVLFAVGAAYFIVQRIAARPKTTFAAPPTRANSDQPAREHKVQMQKKQQTMSAPAAMQRVTTTATNTKVALPQMPAMPVLPSRLTPVTMAGMGGTGIGLTMGGGSQGGGQPGGRGPNLFGLSSGKGLKGTFYDLKQTAGKKPTKVNSIETFVHELNQFLTEGWNEGFLAKYFKAPVSLYANQIFVPNIASEEAPKAFGVDKDVQPSFWMALYKGQVAAPESGIYHFVGGGDNILIVRFDGKIVLDRSWDYQSRFGIDKYWKPLADYNYGFRDIPNGFAKGQGIDLRAGEFHEIEILLGDDGGLTHFSLLVEKEGAQYAKTDKGLPILPVFRTAAEGPTQGEHPPFQPDGPVWKSRETSVSSF